MEQVTNNFTTCPQALEGQHSVLWVQRPAMTHNGEQVSGEELRGICDLCGELFALEASAATHDVLAAWHFVRDSYGDYSPNRAEWSTADILGFVAQYHIHGLDAVRRR